MSMLSAQCDALRERAKTLRQGRWSDGADDARLMEDAADTIWELRDSVHRERAEADRLREVVSDGEESARLILDESRALQAENAKLRKELESVGTAAYLYGRSDLKAENAKLRDENQSIGLAAYELGRNSMADENARLRELAVSYDSALRRMCDQMQRYVDCHDCILGKDYDNEDSCAIDELRDAACVVKVELE